MTNDYSHLYLAWRKGRGHRRIIIGEIDLSANQFKYILEGVKEAQKMGMGVYTEFPDVHQTYNNALSIFSSRLNKSTRTDIDRYYDYWEIPEDKRNDTAFLLARTGGMLPTDNFEMVADYNPQPDLQFVSEICSLSHRQLPPDMLSIGEELNYELEPGNEKDACAVKVYKSDKTELGYIKRIHSAVFHKDTKKNYRITVKSLERNGHLNRCFILITAL